MTHPELLKRITVHPDIFDGKPIIRDMRISVELYPELVSPRGKARGHFSRLSRTRRSRPTGVCRPTHTR